MTFRSRALVIVLLIVVSAMFTADAEAAASKLTRVSLLRSGSRLSVALDMTTEPEKVVMRNVAPMMLEVEVGPVSGRVESQQLTPAVDVPFVAQVSIREFSVARRPTFLRMRVSLRGSSHSNVRIVGRTVYIDFATPAAKAQRLSDPIAAPVSRRTTAEAPNADPHVSYRRAIGAPVARLTEIGPFLIAAANMPTAEILDAMARTLTEVHDSLRAVDVPSEAVPAHTLLTSAVVTAGRAVAADFNGDRVAQARRALALVDDAKARIP